MQEEFESTTRELHFSIQGEFITQVAREKLYYDNDIIAAIELLMSSTVTDQMTKAERLLQALKILNGDLKIAGVYPGDTYGVYEDTPDEPDKLKNHFRNMRQSLNQKTDRLNALQNQIDVLNISMPDRLKQEVQDICGNWGIESPFETISSKEEKISFMGQELSVQDTLEHMKTHDDDSDYGWLGPDGTFIPSEFGSHTASAMRIAKKYYPDDVKKHIGREDEILYEHSWILLHNPSYGTAFPSYAPDARITKKQKDFIYQYYIDRDKPGKADKYMQEL